MHVLLLFQLNGFWPWYVAGPLIGLTVPLLLVIGNKALGISSALRHICAICIPGNVKFLKYDWKTYLWQLWFAGGLVLGGWIGGVLLNDGSVLLPANIFNWASLLSWPNGFIVLGGGFLVGFGTRYANGCTSGHGIYGLATFQWSALVATIVFFAFGILTSNFLLPLLIH